MDGDSVGHCGEARMDFHFRSDDAGASPARAERLEVLADERSSGGSGSGQRQAESVQNCFLAQDDHVFRDVLVLRVHDKFGDVFG